MLNGSENVILVVLVYFIIVSIVLTLLFRISLALDKIGEKLDDISKSLADKKDK